MCKSATRICADCRTRSFGRCLLTLPLPDAAYSLGESSECCERQCCKNQRSFEMLMTSAMGGGQVRLRCFDTLRGRSSVLTLRHLSCNTQRVVNVSVLASSLSPAALTDFLPQVLANFERPLKCTQQIPCILQEMTIAIGPQGSARQCFDATEPNPASRHTPN